MNSGNPPFVLTVNAEGQPLDGVPTEVPPLLSLKLLGFRMTFIPLLL